MILLLGYFIILLFPCHRVREAAWPRTEALEGKHACVWGETAKSHLQSQILSEFKQCVKIYQYNNNIIIYNVYFKRHLFLYKLGIPNATFGATQEEKGNLVVYTVEEP